MDKAYQEFEIHLKKKSKDNYIAEALDSQGTIRAQKPFVLEMDKRGVCFSSGSACHSGSPEPSHALLAMGLTDEEAHCALRFSLGYENTREEIDWVIRNLKEIIEQSKNIIRFISCK